MGARIRTLLLLLPALLPGCGGGAGPEDAAELVSRIPAEADLVAFVDIAAVREHPLFAKIRDDPFLQGGEETLQQLQEVTGLNPIRDCNMLLFAARRIGEPDMEMAVIARGQFDRGRIEELLQGSGWAVMESGTLDLYGLPLEGSAMLDVPELQDMGALRLAFLDDYTIALGGAGLLEATAAVRSGRSEALIDSEDLGPMVAEGLGSGQFWGAFRSRYLAEQLEERIEEGIPGMGILRGFSGVRGIRFSMRFSQSIDLVARAYTDTEDQARLLADTLTGFLALAKLVAKDQPDILRFLEGTLVGLDLDSVRLSMNVDGATLDRIRGGLFEQIRP
ncbi:MAG: hypothetical protein PVF68_07545 [Acidobacteriota bacterium]|jgi:hypothetical protein